MIARMLKSDFLRNKIINIIVFIFIMLSSLLVASATNIMINLSNAMNHMFEKSKLPHFVQMHTGEINQKLIDEFVSENKLVKAQQTAEMINIDSSDLFFHNKKQRQNNSVMDNSFVKQNSSFDFLLGLNNEVINVSQGEIAVPIYYMKKNDLHIGDTVWIANHDFEMKFTITTFVRDAQMNPSIVSSKRFVIHDKDWEVIKENIGETEYLIEFQLTDVNKINVFESIYTSSKLPQTGTTVTYPLYKTLNSVSDGITVLLIIFISILLMGIAFLCIRFIIIATMEEDYREIGVMKGIGIASKDIQKLYVTKYIILAATATICGYVISLFIDEIFTANISLYMGTAERTMLDYSGSLLSAMIVFITVVAFCKFILRKFRYITVVEALKKGETPYSGRHSKFFNVHKSQFFNVNLLLGLKDVFERFKTYSLLTMIFIICTFAMIVPVNVFNTVQSPQFITYMGAGKSDIRIDLQHSENVTNRFQSTISYMERDKDVEKYTALITKRFQVFNDDGTYENINVEIGDFTVFPLNYVTGAAPKKENEIALSYMNAKQFKKNVGDQLTLLVDGEKTEFVVCGIYQDITNGGKTAKALLHHNSHDALWYVVHVNVLKDGSVNEKIAEYEKAFPLAKVTGIDEYVSQTLGPMIHQLKLVTVLSIIISIIIAALVTAMFFKMLIAKDASQIVIMKSIGFSYSDIRMQYITRSLITLCIGVIIGTVLSNTVGQWIVNALGGMIGASSMQFIVNPLETYVICPLLLIITVMTMTIMSISGFQKNDLHVKER
ncbi:ABC transporter permease [Bacillus manliponensis]|uniref:ABC transporter permease n=1 Tax=Bacillus manliponensis TaxID=574376 RepID=A0A073JVA9_9BACI|nr:ABC transporter permease [Bacillus manliponensis]KEK18245.1 ABC transporter permease [Bacillus manliponensis]